MQQKSLHHRPLKHSCSVQIINTILLALLDAFALLGGFLVVHMSFDSEL